VVTKRLSEAEVAHYCQYENIFRAAQFHARGVLNIVCYWCRGRLLLAGI